MSFSASQAYVGKAGALVQLLACGGALAMVAAGSPPHAEASSPQQPGAYVPIVVAEYPHDPNAFTQGLLFHEEQLYESTGLYGLSSLRRVDLETGEVLLQRSIPSDFFAEGLAVFDDRLIQLTWREGVALVWDIRSLVKRNELRIQGEGWGLTSDGHSLIMSDGSSFLTFLDPENLAERRRVQVTFRGQPLQNLNELEWADESIWANVWHSDEVVRIDPQSGEVTGVADLAVLRDRFSQEQAERLNVLNGIAWRRDKGTFLVTGKLWPKIFEVRFEPAPLDAGRR